MLEIYQELANLMPKGERAVLATVISCRGSTPRKPGTKMLIREDGACTGTVGGGIVEHEVQQKAREIMNSGKPELLQFVMPAGEMDIFFEPILPREVLYLFGAGHVAQSTAALGKMLGFRVTVIDPRPDYNNSNRFPDADSLLVEDYRNCFPKISAGENSYLVIFTATHESDELCLHFAARTKAAYVGMIGSKKKVAEIRAHLLQQDVTPEQLDRVHSPVGLDIGARTPEEIAVSIMAEVIREKRSRSG
ncbi:MAG: XdhC/CoxI family protein [Chloroflexota bacterium]